MSYELLIGDCRETLRTLSDNSINCCVTSPPYFGLRDYGHGEQIGLEPTPGEFVEALVAVFREVRRVLRDDGTVWLNLGDSYGKGKQLLGMPWRAAFALQDDGWTLRQEIIWSKPNCMPSSVTDRCVSSREHLFLLAKNPRYYFDHEVIREDAVSDHPSGNGFKRPARLSYQNSDGTARGNDQQWKGVGGKRNRRDVWTVPVRPYKGAHFATFPPSLIEPCILAGCPEGGTVLDPFGGSGTTAGVALVNKRKAILCELNAQYADLIDDRVRSIVGEPAEKQADLFMEVRA